MKGQSSAVDVRCKQTSRYSDIDHQSAIADVEVVEKRRKTSLIVTGLEPTINKFDPDLYCDEFHIQPDVVDTKRLGKDCPATDKTEPCLVVFRKAEQVEQLIAFSSIASALFLSGCMRQGLHYFKSH
jgi:hypothetical protein